MGDFARKKFARTTAVLGLAATMAIGMGGIAKASPADRASDPVVLKGSALPKLNGADPGRVVAYKWNGSWVQVPVQIDERHVVSARSLYPKAAPAYVNNISTFDVEVYADAKTRSGADADASFDADDELVFMGGDTGKPAPKGAPVPIGVVASSASRVDVADPVGGGSAQLYLFRSSSTFNLSVSKDYVQYEFKALNLTDGQTLIDDYGFSNSNNPEDSTVTTDNYELHSTDRWNEDELKIKVGGASGADFLDREAVSAGGLGKCSRSEYTFSGNWDRGSDNDEGTYVAIKDGPVRAIRSYMGANSGPYVQDDHLYYSDREDRSINVRVHPIPEMFVWTDYSDAAVGMTYRDQKNPAGVSIDGNPDSLVPTQHSDVEGGKYLWQQVAGSHGTVTSMVVAKTAQMKDTDEGKYSFGGYYLDDTSPSSASGDRERQCGGDMKAYGASGFGINGMFPNTDPILGTTAEPERKLSVDRVRYFGAPNGTAAEADSLRERVQQPLSGKVGAAQLRSRSATLRVALANRKVKARPGKSLRLKLKVTNKGSLPISKAKVCLKSAKLGTKPCKKVKNLKPGKSKVLSYRTKVKRNAKGKKLGFGFKYSGLAAELGIVGKGNIFAVKLVG